ncbi:MAG: glycosyltransferase family 2 protein, partial [Chloroflexota bacterium]
MGFVTDAHAQLERLRRTGDAPSEPVARAAETLARWYSTNTEYEVALDRLIHARILNGDSHPERLRVLEHHLLTQLGYFDEARRLFDAQGAASPDLHLVQANLLLRQAAAGELSRQEADRERLTLIDWVFRRKNLVPVSDILSGDVLDYDSLGGNTTASSDVDTGQPVVSIVVPAYNAEQTLPLSVNSLQKQSFPHLQILIVDDASTDGTYAVAKDLAVDDPRIVVLQHSQNLGAYGARNTGLRNATGRYFTVHDADDWSHPQLIERQLKPLERGDSVASFSRLARVTPDMEFLLRPYRPMLEPIHWNYTSLLAGTALLRNLGGWDAVRAHADSELIERMREYYGNDSMVEVDPDAPLSFFLVTGSNITESSGTSLRSVDFGARREYSEQARFWRARISADGKVPTYKRHQRTDAKSPFFCPRSLAPNRDRISQTYDLIIGSDLSLTGGTRRCNLAYIDCARKLGLRVGIFNMPRYRLRGSGTIDSTYRELFQLDDVDLLMPEDRVNSNVLLVHHPPVLRSKFVGYPNIKAARHYLLVNQLPWEMLDYSSVQY